ncbi:hypothetical protein DBV15_07782 [Temnothorax longispinosus]|uniref:Uncharacterized protein n=1 Tax=Temnothorax longispinosus TaxID=300112 RepID=A0A4S2KNC7_9HYME|nr:hypothetical protein DBV15_07782 [Temnothorax longispinosus]
MPSSSLDRHCQGGIAAILAMDSPDASSRTIGRPSGDLVKRGRGNGARGRAVLFFPRHRTKIHRYRGGECPRAAKGGCCFLGTGRSPGRTGSASTFASLDRRVKDGKGKRSESAEAKEHTARAERETQVVPGRKSAISSPCGRVWERGARYEPIRARFADLVSESESARRAFKSARTHRDKRTRTTVFFHLVPRTSRDRNAPRLLSSGKRNGIPRRRQCQERSNESPRLLRMTVSARIHLRTRDLSANRLVAPKKKKRNGVVVRYRSPSRPATGANCHARIYCNPRDTETAMPGAPQTAGRILHRYRYCASGGRQSDITAHQNSPHRRGSREIILICSPSGYGRDATARPPAPRSSRRNCGRSRPLTFEGLICARSGAPSSEPPSIRCRLFRRTTGAVDHSACRSRGD